MHLLASVSHIAATAVSTINTTFPYLHHLDLAIPSTTLIWPLLSISPGGSARSRPAVPLLDPALAAPSPSPDPVRAR
jgi:hypothetical protein